MRTMLHRSSHITDDPHKRTHPAAPLLTTSAHKIFNLQRTIGNQAAIRLIAPQNAPIQRTVYTSMGDMWAVVAPDISKDSINEIINSDSALKTAYKDFRNHLKQMDFIYIQGLQPEADLNPDQVNTGKKIRDVYKINYGLRDEQSVAGYTEPARYIGAILHEMMHITAAIQYSTNVAPGAPTHASNMNLPVPQGAPTEDGFGLTENQLSDPNLGAVSQLTTMSENWDTLRTIAEKDPAMEDHLQLIYQRLDYASVLPGAFAHYDTVLMDLLFYLAAQNLHNTPTYQYAHRMLKEANKRRAKGKGAVQKLQ